MRLPSGAELLLLARCLSRLPAGDRTAAAAELLRDADVAATFLLRNGTLHPLYGDGSLMARCHALSPPSEPMALDRDFLDCVVISCQALLTHSGS